MRYVSTGQVLQTWKNKTSVYKTVYIIYWSVYFDTQSRLAAVSEKAFASGNPPLTYSYQWFWWLNGLEDLPTYSASIYPVLFRDSLTDSMLKFSVILGTSFMIRLFVLTTTVWGSKTALYWHLFSDLWKFICSYWQKMLEICLNKLQDGHKVVFWQ